MIGVVVITFLIGLFLSAFFSGTETGFYRATRTRLALDALSGDPVSRGLIWLANNPALFVATTLIGNNFANYLASWAIVSGTAELFAIQSATADVAVSVMMSPLIFIYGELMPKNMFFAMPNRLLRLAGPIFLGFTVLFAPLSAILFSLGRLLEWILGESPERLQLRLARRELQRVLSEGHEAGVLLPTQRQMADGMFQLATMTLDRFCVPPSKVAVVRETMSTQEMLRIARGRRSSVVFVQDPRRKLIGYHHVVDLQLKDESPRPRPLLKISRRESTIAALTKMQEQNQSQALVMGEHDRVQGIISIDQLALPVLKHG